eukprot:TRINITY_DN5843_c0_g1_i9.p1 TRINITY_DN5843_c0_g1~~TRINITY_DN5843_c0_g1_i9.p1  ORF type:complete len:112 (-),score=10.26 TRINITY_DN5843_c0_g1_i9:421-756(-)
MICPTCIPAILDAAMAMDVGEEEEEDVLQGLHPEVTQMGVCRWIQNFLIDQTSALTQRQAVICSLLESSDPYELIQHLIYQTSVPRSLNQLEQLFSNYGEFPNLRFFSILY